jgi:hypothetical protein
MDPFA